MSDAATLEAALAHNAELQTSLEKAASVGKALLNARTLLQEENRELRDELERLRGPQTEPSMTQATAEELHARIRVLQEQLKEAERANEALLRENTTKTKTLNRLSMSGLKDARKRTPEPADTEKTALLETELAETTKKMTDSESKHVREKQQLEDKVEILQTQLGGQVKSLEAKLKSELEEKKALQKRLGALEAELATGKDDAARDILLRNPDFLKWISNPSNVAMQLAALSDEKRAKKSDGAFVDGLARESLWFLFAVLKTEECASVQQELAQWQQVVRKLGQDKEIAEEKFQETLQNSTAERFHTADNQSLEAENERLNELESARRALMQIRNRTMESEALRKQISVMVKENERLAAELDESKTAREKAEESALQSQIALEIYMEREDHK